MCCGQQAPGGGGKALALLSFLQRGWPGMRGWGQGFSMPRENAEPVGQDVTHPPVPVQVECSVFSEQENNHLINNMP